MAAPRATAEQFAEMLAMPLSQFSVLITERRYDHADMEEACVQRIRRIPPAKNTYTADVVEYHLPTFCPGTSKPLPADWFKK